MGIAGISGVTTRPQASTDTMPIGGGTAAQQASLRSGIDLIGRSSTGRAALQAAARAGVHIEITTDADYADYASGVGPHGTLRINPSVLEKTPDAIAGVLAHETGHALVDHKGYLSGLQGLPDNLGTLANEVVAESLSSAIAKEAGFDRGQSAITRVDGTLRAPAQGLDDILTSDFYLQYYKIDPSKISASDFARSYDAITTTSLALLKSLGATPPAEYTASTTHLRLPCTSTTLYHWNGPKEATVAAAHASANAPAPTPAAPTGAQADAFEAAMRALREQMAARQRGGATTAARGPH